MSRPVEKSVMENTGLLSEPHGPEPGIHVEQGPAAEAVIKMR